MSSRKQASARQMKSRHRWQGASPDARQCCESEGRAMTASWLGRHSRVLVGFLQETVQYSQIAIEQIAGFRTKLALEILYLLGRRLRFPPETVQVEFSTHQVIHHLVVFAGGFG